jgi:hypothetical protein
MDFPRRYANLVLGVAVGMHGLVAFCPATAVGEEPNPNRNKDTISPEFAKEVKFDAKQLIEQLENHNAPPKLVPGRSDGDDPIFDRRYKWSEDDRIARATQALVDHADDALPELLKHFDDKRYSMTDYSSVDAGANNDDIGEVCWRIVVESLSQPFCEHIPDGDDLAYKLRIADRGASADLRTWCAERRDKKFYELQIEQCELAIERVKKLNDDSLGDDPTADRKKSIAEIENQIDALRKNRKPILAKKFGRYFALERFNSEWAEEIRKRHEKK